MTSINDEALKLLENLDTASKEAIEKMKGQYRKNYDDKSEEIIKDFKKTIGKVSKLSHKIQTASEDFWDMKNINMDQVVSDIIDEVNNGIASIQDKIDSINEKISNLESQL